MRFDVDSAHQMNRVLSFDLSFVDLQSIDCLNSIGVPIFSLAFDTIDSFEIGNLNEGLSFRINNSITYSRLTQLTDIRI